VKTEDTKNYSVGLLFIIICCAHIFDMEKVASMNIR